MPVPRRRRQPGLRPQGDRRRARQLGERARPAPGRGAPARRRHRAADRDPQRIADHRDPHRSGVGCRDEAARAAGLAHRGDPRLRRAGTLARRRDADGSRRSDHPHLEPERRPRRGARARDALARRRVDRGGARRVRTSSAPPPRRASPSSSSSGSRRARTSTPPGRSRTASRGSSAPPRSPRRDSSSTGASRRSTRRATTGSPRPRAASGPSTSSGSSASSSTAPSRAGARPTS